MSNFCNMQKVININISKFLGQDIHRESWIKYKVQGDDGLWFQGMMKL